MKDNRTDWAEVTLYICVAVVFCTLSFFLGFVSLKHNPKPPEIRYVSEPIPCPEVPPAECPPCSGWGSVQTLQAEMLAAQLAAGTDELSPQADASLDPHGPAYYGERHAENRAKAERRKKALEAFKDE